MTLLLNYLYRDILESIIIIIYNSNNNSFNNNNSNSYNIEYNLINNCYGNNQVIKLSLVCKYWFELVSEILGSSDILNDKTFKRLEPLIEKPKLCLLTSSFPSFSSSLFSASETQQSYKLIKVKDSIACYKYSERESSEVPLSKAIEQSKLYKRVYISIQSDKIILELFKEVNKVQDNVILDLYPSSSSSLDLSGLVDYSKINSINCNNIGMDHLLKLLKTPPKEIVYSLVSNPYISNTCCFLELIFKSNGNNKINIGDLLRPSSSSSDYNNLSSTSIDRSSTEKVELFKFTSTIESMMNAVPLVFDQNENKYSIDKLKWQYIVDKLSSDSTLVSITYYNYCIEKCGELTEFDINQGLKSILENQKSLKHLTYRGTVRIGDQVLEGLALNQSIKTLDLTYCYNDIGRIVKVLCRNKSIRNLNVPETAFLKWISMFQKESIYKDQLDLYSIKLMIRDHDFKAYLKYLKSNQFNITQFDIIYNYNSRFLKPISYQINSNNNNYTILNILKFK